MPSLIYRGILPGHVLVPGGFPIPLGKGLLSEALSFLPLIACSQASLAAEILFLRKQLAFYQERKIKPRRFDDAARLSMLLLSKLFDWKNALINVKPDTLIGWHRKAFQMFWRWKSRGGSTTAEEHSAIDCKDGER